MKIRVLTIGAAALAGLVLLSSCSALDANKKYSKKSFDALLVAAPTILSDTGDAYVLQADGTASLVIKKDFSGTQDILMETNLKAFTDAGLDTSKLPDGFLAQDGKLILAGDYGTGDGTKTNATDALFQSVMFDRKTLTYHAALDHFGIKLPAGKFEFARTASDNDKDIVFVIQAKPLADIGVDVKNISGWLFKTMQDENGKDVDLLLKPYNLA